MKTKRTKITNTLSAPVIGVDGKAHGKIQLSAGLFGAKINKQLLAQAVRVYLSRQRSGNASTKTRGEVEGSTRKIYRQKGTGRARHGGVRAPIFVGGGIVFGPKPRDFSLNITKKMGKRALASALTSQLKDSNVFVVDGLETLQPKTNMMDKTLKALGIIGKTLIVASDNALSVTRATRNIRDVDVIPVKNLHTYAVLSHKKILFMKEAVASLNKTFKD